MIIGHHLSISKGFPKMIEEAYSMGMTTFSCMIGNPQTGNFIERSPFEINMLNKAILERKIDSFIVHCPYVFNLASKNDYVRDRTIEDMKKIFPYLDKFEKSYYVLHPGSHTGRGVENGIDAIADGLNQIIHQNQCTTILLETMAGKGTEIGKTFKQISSIIERLNYPEKVGVCFDTCHTWDSGYDLSNFKKVIEELKEYKIFDKIKLIHLNDSKNKCGSKKDRHENIGEGLIGLETLSSIINYKDFIDLPFILETNREDENRVIKEIGMIKAIRNKEVPNGEEK